MTDFSLLANFAVVSASASEEITAANGTMATRRRLSLVLRAGGDTELELSSGEHLSTIDTHLTLVAGLASLHELGAELMEEDLGFLLHSASGSEPPFVHGAVAWSAESLPYYLLTQGLRINVLLTISSLPRLLDYDEPHIWESGRKALLRIAAYTISCTNEQAQ